MKIIVQCASSKKTGGSIGNLQFVANPTNKNEAHPDNIIPNTSITWREHIQTLNGRVDNKYNLYKVGELYKPKIYKQVIDKFGFENVYILSAGWGLVRSDYLIPNYDITFSNSADLKYKRKKDSKFEDFNQLELDDKFIFFGGESYLPLLYKLTKDLSSYKEKIIYHATNTEKHPGYTYVKYPRCFTNWHYSALIDYITNPSFHI